MRRVLLPILTIFALATPALAAPAPTPASRLHALFEADWEWRLADDPLMASLLGDRRHNARWQDLSPAAAAKRVAHAKAMVAAVDAVPKAGLTAADRLNADLFRREWGFFLEEDRYRWDAVAVTHKGGVHTVDELLPDLRFETAQDYRDWLGRLRAYPTLVRQTEDLLALGAARGRILPKVLLDRVPGQLARHQVADAADSPFYAPFKAIPAAIPAAEADRLRAEARAAINRGVIPALTRHEAFLRERYLPKAPVATGIGHQPDGAALYALLARRHTTTAMSPDAIHDVGLREVARIRREMEAIKARTGFQGDLPAFFAFLRTDPRFKPKDAAALLEAYRTIAKRIDPKLTAVFRTFPRLPYGVEPIPDAVAPDTTTAYYMPPAADGSRAGTFYVNLYKPEVRPTYEMMALSLHEAVPGHHFQIARAMELAALPKFRRYGGDATAFVEGWGLYAESLGDEMGLYDDPYAKFGQLTYEMWRAVRLVVDTGMHVKGWSRDRAIRYFLDNAAKTEHDVVNEIDRYLADPGQALAYKIGELKFKALRAKAAQALGPRFDKRDFHDMLLAEGALPLELVERRVDAYIAARKR